MAVQLGVYILHCSIEKKKVKFSRYDKSKIYTEAVWFAAEFLMPKNKFLDYVEKYGVGRTADICKVPWAMAQSRYDQLIGRVE